MTLTSSLIDNARFNLWVL